jgi:hypothetical protein
VIDSRYQVEIVDTSVGSINCINDQFRSSLVAVVNRHPGRHCLIIDQHIVYLIVVAVGRGKCKRERKLHSSRLAYLIPYVACYLQLRKILSDHASRGDGEFNPLHNGVGRGVAVRPVTIVCNHVSISGSYLLVIRSVELYFTSGIEHFENYSTRISISAV